MTDDRSSLTRPVDLDSGPFVICHSDELQARRSEEHTSELQSHLNLVCRLLLEKKKSTNLYPIFAHARFGKIIGFARPADVEPGALGQPNAEASSTSACSSQYNVRSGEHSRIVR